MELLTSPASGLGLATFAGSAPDAPILDVWYPRPTLSAEPTAVPHLEDAGSQDPIRGVVTRVVSTTIDDLSAPPADVADAYLRLHLLSHRLVAPRTINLDGIFGVLPNVAWTSLGPVAIDGRDRGAPARPGRERTAHRARRRQVPAHGRLRGARPACASPTPTGCGSAPTWPRARPSCTRASATSTPARSGTSMVEGRISAGVVVGDGSDIGGGASIMGTLSGGGKEQVTIGEGA